MRKLVDVVQVGNCYIEQEFSYEMTSQDDPIESLTDFLTDNGVAVDEKAIGLAMEFSEFHPVGKWGEQTVYLRVIDL